MLKVPWQVWQMGRIATKEPTRYRLDGIYFHEDDGKQRAVATNGKVMIVMTWPLSDGESILEAFVQSEVCDLLRKTKAIKQTVIASVDDGMLILMPKNNWQVRATAMPKEFKWPDYRSILKSCHERSAPPEDGSEWLDPAELGNALACVGSLQDDGHHGLQFSLKKDGPVYFCGKRHANTDRNAMTVEGFVMPMTPG